jgi:hypothetical protein
LLSDQTPFWRIRGSTPAASTFGRKDSAAGATSIPSSIRSQFAARMIDR